MVHLAWPKAAIQPGQEEAGRGKWEVMFGWFFRVFG